MTKPKLPLLHGLHDREWIEKQLRAHPDSPHYQKWLKEDDEARRNKWVKKHEN